MLIRVINALMINRKFKQIVRFFVKTFTNIKAVNSLIKKSIFLILNLCKITLLCKNSYHFRINISVSLRKVENISYVCMYMGNQTGFNEHNHKHVRKLDAKLMLYLFIIKIFIILNYNNTRVTRIFH